MEAALTAVSTSSLETRPHTGQTTFPSTYESLSSKASSQT
jgi:hypothetical protein